MLLVLPAHTAQVLRHCSALYVCMLHTGLFCSFSFRMCDASQLSRRKHLHSSIFCWVHSNSCRIELCNRTYHLQVGGRLKDELFLLRTMKWAFFLAVAQPCHCSVPQMVGGMLEFLLHWTGNARCCTSYQEGSAGSTFVSAAWDRGVAPDSKNRFPALSQIAMSWRLRNPLQQNGFTCCSAHLPQASVFSYLCLKLRLWRRSGCQ